MPGVTSPRNYPFPLGPEPIDIAGDIKRLAEAIDDDVNGVAVVGTNNAARIESVNSNLQAQINTNLANGNWHQAQISDLYARRAVMYHANNATGIATLAGGWVQYQCGTLVLATYNYNYFTFDEPRPITILQNSFAIGLRKTF